MSQTVHDNLQRDERESKRKAIDNGHIMIKKSDESGTSRISSVISQISNGMTDSNAKIERKRKNGDTAFNSTEIKTKSSRPQVDNIDNHRDDFVLISVELKAVSPFFLFLSILAFESVIPLLI